MNTYCRLFLLTFTVMLTGCIFATGPSNNLAFNDTASLESLEGVYQNIGEADKSLAPSNVPDFHVYLSKIIWPKDKELDHAAITAVEVRKTEDKTLTVKAIENGKPKKLSIFVEGRDFDLKAGRIVLKSEAFLSDPIVGLGHGTVELGVDSGGHGKYRMEDTTVGLAYLVMPIAAKEITDVRFVKISQ